MIEFMKRVIVSVAILVGGILIVVLFFGFSCVFGNCFL